MSSVESHQWRHVPPKRRLTFKRSALLYIPADEITFGILSQKCYAGTEEVHEGIERIVVLRTENSPDYRVQLPPYTLLRTTNKTNKQTPWPLVRGRTIPTDRPPLVDEI
jgi:hypothetical protein